MGSQKLTQQKLLKKLIKEKFKRDEWLETQTVKGFFSRLAARQRGQEIGSQQDHDQDLALESILATFGAASKQRGRPWSPGRI